MTASRKPKLATIPADAKSVYDGRHHLGWTVPRGKSFEAINFDRVPLGLFETALQARNALWCGEEVSHG